MATPNILGPSLWASNIFGFPSILLSGKNKYLQTMVQKLPSTLRQVVL